MCEKCIQKYQGMPLATAENELAMLTAKLCNAVDRLLVSPTPVEHVATELEIIDTLKPIGDLAQYIHSAKAAKRNFLSPATDGLVVQRNPLAELMGLNLPPKVITTTWAATVNSRTPEGRDKLREENGLPPFADEDGDDLPKFPLM